MWSRAKQTLRRINQTWSELDYAQRRLFEVRTGIPVTPEGARAQARAEAHELEVLFAREHPDERSTPALAPLTHS